MVRLNSNVYGCFWEGESDRAIEYGFRGAGVCLSGERQLRKFEERVGLDPVVEKVKVKASNQSNF